MSAAPASHDAFGARPAVAEVEAALAVLGQADLSRLWMLSHAEVAQVMRGLEQVRTTVESQQVAVMAETRSRRLGVEDGWSPVDWAMRAAPGMSAPHAAQLDVVAAAGEDSRLDELTEAVSTGALSVPKAAQVTRFHREVAGLAEPEELAEITHHLVAGASGSTGLTERQLAVAIRRTGHLLKPDRDLDRQDEAMRRHRALVKGPGPAGMTSYRLLLDPEGAAILDAAIDPLARPQRDDESGERDERTPATRRADALLTVIGRGVSSPGEQPKAAKSQLVVTVRLDQLMAGLRGSGITLGQEALSPGTVRRLACDADLVPVVLGTGSELLDVGRRKRLVPPAIRLAAWLRDGGCTYPGCSIPAQWCDAHHGRPWWQGGDTSLLNTALLCQRHHTIVHQRELVPSITPEGVAWHL